MKRMTRKIVHLLAATFMTTLSIHAQAQNIQTRHDLDALKAEMVHRAQINLYPVFGIPADIMRDVTKDVKTLQIDEWAEAFMKEANAFYNKAMNEERADHAAALSNYEMAQRLFNMGRWPALLTASRAASYQMEIKAFEAVQRLKGLDLERIENDYREHKTVAYLVKPQGQTAPAPLVISIGGLDGWKEARITQLALLVSQGVAILSLDMPGTGQSGVKMGPDAEPSLFAMIDKVLTRGDIDRTRVVLYGGSFGGYWTTLLAARNKLHLVGVVDQSGPFAHTFEPQQLGSVFDGSEYLYDSLPALSNLFEGVTGREQLLSTIKNYAIDQLVPAPLTINCPVLVIGGKHDSLVPQEDLVPVLFSDGAPRQAWINPNGIHMGRERGSSTRWDDKAIYHEVVFPWVLARLSTW